MSDHSSTDYSDEQKRMESAVAEAQERLRMVVESSHEHAIISMDLDRKITSWNPGAERIFGYPAHEVIGEDADVIFTPEDREMLIPEREAEQALKKGRASDNRWQLRKGGDRFWANGAMLPMRASPATVAVGFVKILRDETEGEKARVALEQSRRALQAALGEAEQANARAEAASQAKDHFLAVLSHELRTPLTPVSMIAEELLKQPDLDAALREDIEVIDRNIKIECRLIDDLLDLSRIVHGKFAIVARQIDLHEVIRAAVSMVEQDIHSKKQILTLDLRATSHHVKGDAVRLQQVVWNLLKNATKFTPHQGSITIRTWVEDGTIVTEVKDTGIGMRPEMLQGIFDAFAQGEEEIARRFGGLGLGLAISKATLAAHESSLSASSEGMDQGSTFVFRLPLAD